MTGKRDGYDFIVIGAGSSGCVLANRLSADPGRRVLLIEAGGSGRSIYTQMPAGVGAICMDRNRFNWGFWTEAEPHLNGRKLWYPRGRGLGGTSLINGMIFIRGHRSDYDEWKDLGADGWSYDEVLPYFKKLEHYEAGANAFHGDGGPIWVSKPKASHPIYRAFLDAAASAGYPATDDFNGATQEGFGRYALNIKNGSRSSAAAGYLVPILGKRANLTVATDARVTRIRVEHDRAVAVDYVQARSGEARTAYADQEIVLSAGAIQSPHILQLSGIGDAAELRRAGVKVSHDLPGVGKNLQDHLDVILAWETPGQKTSYAISQGLGKLWAGMQYLAGQRGPARQNFLEVGGFIKSEPALTRPDVQLHCVLGVLSDPGEPPARVDGFSVHACLLRPESRGSVGLRSLDPFDDPTIVTNAYGTDNDRRALQDAVRMVEEIAQEPSLRAVSGNQLRPSKGVTDAADLDEWIRSTSEMVYHPAGTCAMGADGDPWAVLDSRLRVRGIAGLRVADASVMPRLVGGNTNAPSMMIGEKAAAMILGNAA